MPEIFPDLRKTRVVFASKGEELFYQACLDGLSEEWSVFYSCTISSAEKGEGSKENEIDFVVYHPKWGAMAIEVKGGGIKYAADSGKFFSINRAGESFAIKNPFQQALVWKSRFVRLSREKNLRVPVSHAVCFSNIQSHEIPSSSEFNSDLIIGRNHFENIEEKLIQIAKNSHPPRFLAFDDCRRELKELLIGRDFATKLNIRQYIDSHETRLKDLEYLHDSLTAPLAGSLRLGIEGEAGTGKTMLGLNLAKFFRDKNQKTLLLSSNGLLNLYLKQEAGENVSVKTYEEIASDLGINPQRPPADYTEGQENWLQYGAPEALIKAVAHSDVRYEVIICDEAQDVQPFWWEVIEGILKDSSSRLYIFFDRSQGVFNHSGNDQRFIPEEILPVPAPYFPLVQNYRTTSEIASLSRRYRTGKHILASHTSRLGYIPELVLYDSKEDFKQKSQILLQKLIGEEGLQSEDLAIISARRPSADASVLRGLQSIGRHPLHELGATNTKTWKEVSAPRGTIPVATVQAFKGLETNVALLVNFSEYNLPLSHPLMSSLLYVAATRAKHMLYIFLQKDDDKVKDLREAIDSIKSSGAVILDASQGESEYLGEVVHYNPDRIGWLTVSDAQFGRSSVMFFPKDVQKSGIANIQVGDKIFFRPRAEGPAIIAGDLKTAS